MWILLMREFFIFLLLPCSCYAQLQQVWLTAIQPFTGADWDAGVSMRFGAEIMLEQVNQHSNLLNGFELKVVWQDGQCAKAKGTDIFLSNILNKEYKLFAPVPVDKLDADKDGVITTADTEPLQVTYGSAEISPDPIGLLGSGCSGTAINIANIAYLARYPMISNSATRPGLSDREKFPNFYRTIMPDTFFNAAWIAMAKILGQSSVAVVIGETEAWVSAGVQIARDAREQSVDLVGFDLSAEMTDFRGLQISIDSQSAASVVATELVRLKQRVVILLLFATRNRLLMCEAYKKGYVHAVYMVMGWLAYDWWSVDDTRCTPSQLTSMANGFISANAVMFRYDDDKQLSCSETMTAGQFKTEWFARQGAPEGDLSMRPEGYSLAKEAATTADAVCMYAQMLDEILVKRNGSLSELAQRTPNAYNEIQEVLAATDFEGVQGRVRFGRGQADPQGSVILQQLQENGSIKDIALYSHPVFSFLGTSDLVFGMPGEAFSTGPPGASTIVANLTPWVACPDGKTIDYSTNTCVDCPAGEIFIDSAGLCGCMLGFAGTTGQCTVCPPGSITKEAGQIACTHCPVGKFAAGSGMTECSWCPAGYFSREEGSSECELFTRDVFLTSIQPFTGADWDAGISMRFGAQIMLEEVNKHSTLLKGFRLKVLWQDGQCAKKIGTDVFMDNIFHKKYDIFAPVRIDQLDADGDGVITTADTANFSQVWNRSLVSPDPVGLLGPGCSGTSINIASIAFQARFPIISNSATRPGLSDRSQHPNFFRTVLPDTFFNAAWIAMAKVLGQLKIASVIGDTENWASMGERLARDAVAQGVELVGVDLSAEIQGFHGLQMSIDSPAAAKAVVSELFALKQRVVILLMFAKRNRLVLCEAFKQGYFNAVYMTFGWLAYGWWSVSDTDCTPVQLTRMVDGFISANAVFFRYDNDKQLSCSEGMTAAMFRTEWFARQGAAEGNLSMRPEGYAPALEAATTADAVCMYAQMLHEVLINRGIQLSELAARTAHAYDQVQEVLAATDFEGVAGRVRFGPGKADPQGSIILEQFQQGIGKVDIATYNHPVMTFLGKNDLVFTFPNERFPTNGTEVSAPLTPYAACTGNSMLDMQTNKCVDCPHGQIFLEEVGGAKVQKCACQAGYVTHPETTRLCIKCKAGSFTAVPGKTICDKCPTARYSSEEGSTQCLLCQMGFHQAQVGQSECVACAPGLTTLFLGAISSSECVCAKGKYNPLGEDTCLPCPDGMECAAGSDMKYMPDGPGPFPLVLAGHMSLIENPLQVYDCQLNYQCPGGKPATCAPYRDTTAVACGRCGEDAYESDGMCHRCGGATDILPIVVVVFVAIACICIMTVAINQNLLMKSNAVMTCVIMLGLMFTGVQTMGVFKQLSIDWFEPLVSLLRIMSLLSFDLKVLKMDCVYGSDPLVSHLARQLIAPMLVPFIFVTVYTKKRREKKTDAFVEIINTIGTIFNIFFISILISALTPLNCYPHPGSADLSSMVTAPSILCFRGSTYTNMLLVGLFALMTVPIPFVGMAAYFTWKYPMYITGIVPGADRNLQAFRFLFFRFTPARYYFGLVVLTRSLIVCLVPVVVRDDVVVQICAMATSLGFFVIVQQQMNPWRSYATNIMDGVLTMCLQLLLICGAMATNTSKSTDSISVVGATCFTVFLIVGFGTLGFGLYKRFRPWPWYGYFVCHHKAHAAAQARLVKVLLQIKSSKDVFIDSDNLRELDELFDIVKSKVEHLLVFLTRDTLSRPWCSGEIVTAFNVEGIKVSTVRAPGFLAPTNEQLADLESYLDLTSCTLSEYGITMEHVRVAYERLLDDKTRSISLDTSYQGSMRFEKVVNDILSIPFIPGKLPTIPNTPGMVIISTNILEDEALAATAILHRKIQEDVLRRAAEGLCCLADHSQDINKMTYAVAQSRTVVVILSANSMQSLAQLMVIADVMEIIARSPGNAPALIPVTIDGFEFPNEFYYKEVLPKIWPGDGAAQEESLQAFFKRIAVPLNIGASDQVIHTQAREISSRIPKKFSVSGAKTRMDGLTHKRLPSMIDLRNVQTRRQFEI